MKDKRISHNELAIKQKLPLEMKEQMSLRRIAEWIEYYDDKSVYVSYSGGKDSLVVGHLVHRINLNIPLVFVDTGLELPSLRKEVLNKDGVVVRKPKMNFSKVIQKYGYPVVSKDISTKVYKLRRNNLTPEYRSYILHGSEKGSIGKLPEKWKFLIETDFCSSAHCCNIMKKQPFHAYERETGRVACITGEMAQESMHRRSQYLRFGCNAFDRKSGPKSMPIAFWTEQDVLAYILKYDLKLPSVYGDIIEINSNLTTSREKRTGCCFCMYGLEYDTDRFIRLKKSYPKIYDYCMRGGKYDSRGEWVPDKGLGMKHVIKRLAKENDIYKEVLDERE